MPPVEAGGERRVEVIKKLSTGLSPQSVPGQLGQRPLAERTRAGIRDPDSAISP